ncbi:hypothetical protein JCM10213_003643 [Rhodosporidiobolus nylandii]
MAHDELLASWTAEQLRQASLAVFNDDRLSFAVHAAPAATLPSAHPDAPVVYREDLSALRFEGLHTVGGLDISFPDASGDEGIAVLAVLSFPNLQLLHTLTRRISLSSTPYVHSYLSFREADHYIALVEELRAQDGARVPQVLFVDGNGRWHPRQAGSAVAVGVKTGIPTVGIGKEYHPLHSPSSASPATLSSTTRPPFPPDFRSTQKGMRKACQALLKARGDWLGLVPPAADEGGGEKPESGKGEYWGAAVLTSPSRTASNPIFVSPGTLLSLSTCIGLALACCTESKVLEPVRRADAIGREEVRKTWGTNGTTG